MLFRESAPALRRRCMFVVGALIAGGLTVAPASAGQFSARRIHRGLAIDLPDGTTGRLVPRGWFRRPGDATFVYHAGGVTVAGVWLSGPDAAVVRSGRREDSPPIGRIVPSWDDEALRLTIEPAGGPAFRTDVFAREAGGRSTLNRGISTREALEGTYRATLRSLDGKDAGWLSVDIDPEGATRFQGSIPSAVPPALAAAAAAAVDSEIDFIYENVVDVGPLHR